jgi:phosphoribosylformylglycinamidine cyclo-ligase
MYGEALLDSTIIYVPLVEDCLNEGVDIHYAVNITGHGWRKLMRATQPFKYVIDNIPAPQPVFSFIQEHGPVDDMEAYANLNMGAGFALYVRDSDVAKLLSIVRSLGMSASRAGTIESSKVKRVIINPLGLEYLGSTLGVR